MSKKEESTAIAEAKNTAVALPDFANFDDFGQGFEGADSESFALPFIAILQKMSPMVDEDDPKYLSGAKAGMLLNTVTQKLYDGKTGIVIVPAAYKRTFIRWGGRDADGGFKGELSVEEFKALVDKGEVQLVDGKYYVPDEDGKINEKKSDYFADTRSHFVVVVDEESGEFGQALISLSSSMIKSSRMLMTSLQQKKVETPRGRLTPPTFLNKVRLTTVGQSNDKGTWSVAKFELEGLVTDKDVYNAAKELHEAVRGGEVNVDRTKQETPTDSGVGDKPEEAEGF